MNTPVVFFVFNRPELTAQVLARIRKVRPAQLLVVCDGPRANILEDGAKVEAVRRIIDEGVDWPCSVSKEYAKNNMGCRARVVSGLNWAFLRVEEAIILEDDCLPDLTFFAFATEMLARYREDHRVLHVGGNNFTGDQLSIQHSYGFSRYGHIWGWATWRRAWAHYEWDISSWKNSDTRRVVLTDLKLRDERGYWGAIFDRCSARPEEQTTWDYQWTYSCWKQRGLAIYPSQHLVQNIGQGENATHTHFECPLLGHAAIPVSFPLRHPGAVVEDAQLDQEVFRSVFMGARPWGKKLLHGLKNRLSRIVY